MKLKVFILIMFFFIWAAWGAMSWLCGWLVSGEMLIYEWAIGGRIAWVLCGVLIGAVLSYVVVNQFLNKDEVDKRKK